MRSHRLFGGHAAFFQPYVLVVSTRLLQSCLRHISARLRPNTATRSQEVAVSPPKYWGIGASNCIQISYWLHGLGISTWRMESVFASASCKSTKKRLPLPGAIVIVETMLTWPPPWNLKTQWHWTLTWGWCYDPLRLKNKLERGGRNPKIHCLRVLHMPEGPYVRHVCHTWCGP